MSVCILDAWHPDDPALLNSHWVAEQTTEVLRRGRPYLAVDSLSGEAVDPTTVSAALDRPYAGFAYYGHGCEHLLYHRGRVPLLGREQVHRLGARWFHAFACLSGDTLCQDALEGGAAAYLGYRVRVILDWDPTRLPDELRERLIALITAATLQLVDGVRSTDAIRRHVRAASDRLVEWMIDHEDAALTMDSQDWMGLHALASLLERQLVLKGVAVTD